MASGRHLFACRASGACRSVNSLSKRRERFQDSDSVGCQRGTPVRPLAGHGTCERHAENTLGASNVFPRVAIRPSDIPCGQGERSALSNRAQQMQAAISHDEMAVVLNPNLGLRLDGYVWPFLLIPLWAASTLRHVWILPARRTER